MSTCSGEFEPGVAGPAALKDVEAEVAVDEIDIRRRFCGLLLIFIVPKLSGDDADDEQMVVGEREGQSASIGR